MLKHVEKEFKNWFVKDDLVDPSNPEKKSEAQVYYPRTIFFEYMILYEKIVTEIYQNAAEKFKNCKGIILSLGLTY